MSSNVYDMSSASTPSRVRPALVIPGIDSKSSLDGKASLMSCHGLPTPPQSALESRRHSLQFPATPDYVPSSGAYSQPTTPVRALTRHGDASSHSWTGNVTTASNTPKHLTHSITQAHLSQALLQPAPQSQPIHHLSNMDILAPYEDATMRHTGGTFGLQLDTSGNGAWSLSHLSQPPVPSEASSSLGPPLFAMSHVLEPDNNKHDALDIEAVSAYQPYPFTGNAGGFHTYGSVPSNIYSQPQVIVPSQLSPEEDFSQHHYQAFASPHDVVGSYSTNFSSSTGSLGDSDILRPPSPTPAYFTQSDEEDYRNVPFVRSQSPSYNASVRRAGGTTERRRPLRRNRKTAAPVTFSHYTGDTEVVCENFDPAEGPPRQSASRVKKYRCTHLHDNGTECGSAFDRAEHLKRHAGMHSNVKMYPCPLPKCHWSIQRPDNAADHFKTHLRPPKPGKRNQYFDWPVVRRAILQAYAEKRARKMLDNLQKWIDAGMPESASQRRGNPAASRKRALPTMRQASKY